MVNNFSSRFLSDTAELLGRAAGRFTKGFALGLAEETASVLKVPQRPLDIGLSQKSAKEIAEVVSSRSPEGFSCIAKILVKEGTSNEKATEVIYWCLKAMEYVKGHVPKHIARACANLLGGMPIR